jgi:rod shape-determining protein MreC
MRKRKKLDKNKYVLIILIIFVIIGFIVNIFMTNRNLTIFEKAIKDSIYTVERVILIPIDYIGNKIKETKEMKSVYEEYKNISENENDSIELENEELKKQLSQMKDLLQLNETLYEYDYINATVISRNINFWSDTVVIDKGQSSGIVINLPVVVKEGLIGKVISTTEYTSTVRLLTANNSNDKISVKIKNNDEYMYGLLNGYDSKTDKYIIEGVSYSKDIKLDSIVTTTGMGDLFPSGIAIGYVSGISTDQFDLANIIEVTSLVDFDDINYVTVLKRGSL